jgi:hypothetical protein
VATGKQCHQHFIDDLVLPDDDFSQFAQNALAPLGDARRESTDLRGWFHVAINA